MTEIPARPGAGEPVFLTGLLIPVLIGTYLLLTSTTVLIPGIWPYDAKRILQFALLFILFLTPAFNGRIRAELAGLIAAVPAWLKIVLAVVFSWGVLSALINKRSLMHGLNSLSEVALLAAWVMGVFVVAAGRRATGRLFDRVAVAMLAMTGLTVGLQELIGVIAAHDAGVDFNFRVSLLHFSWPRFYNQVQSWMIPVLAALPVLFARNRLAYFLCVLVLGFQWYIVLMTGARGSFVSIGAAMVFALFFLPEVRSQLFKWQIAGFALGALIFVLVVFSFETGAGVELSESGKPQMIRDADRDAGSAQLSGGESSFFKQSIGRPMAHTSGRTWMWRMALEDVQEHPLIGIGPMNYVCTSPRRIGHPHNFPLQLAAEWGLPAALLACFLVLYLLWRSGLSIRQGVFGNRKETIVAGLIFCGILAAALHACLSGIMVMPASQVTGLLLCGTLLGMYPGRGAEPGRNSRGWSCIGGLLLTAMLLALGVNELATMKARTATLEPGASMWPRIWQDAKVCQLYLVPNEVKN